MKHALLIDMLSTLAVVGGSSKEEPVTVLKVIPLQLPTPTRGNQPFTQHEVILIRGNAQ